MIKHAIRQIVPGWLSASPKRVRGKPDQKDASLVIGSFGSKKDRQQAIVRMQQGGIVAGQMFGVYGIWLNPADRAAVTLAYRAKGETDSTKKLSTMALTETLFSVVLPDALPPQLRELFSEANIRKFQQRFGAIGHIRVPVDPEKLKKVTVPEALMSEQGGKKYLQHLDPFGHGPLQTFIQELHEQGISFVGVTSLNYHPNEPEITTRKRAIAFCQERGIQLLLTDPVRGQISTEKELLTPAGSFTIINAETLSVLREGSIPSHEISCLLGVPLTKDKHTKPACLGLPTVDISYLHDVPLRPELRRVAILLAQSGYSRATIRQEIINVFETANGEAALAALTKALTDKWLAR